MKVYLLREDNSMELKVVGFYLQQILKVNYYIPNKLFNAHSIQTLQEIADEYLLKYKIPLVGMLYTTKNIEDDTTLGVASLRVAFIKWHKEDIKKVVLTTLHELAHLCDAQHCKDNYCLMTPQYYPLPIDNVEFKDLLCNKCFSIVSRSWVYRLLKKDSYVRKSL